MKLLSSMATREVLAELVAAFEAVSGHPVSAESAGGVDVAKRVSSGESIDVVVLAGGALDKLIAAGKVMAAGRADLMKSHIAVAVRTGSARVDVSTEEAVRHAVMGARTLSYSTGPSGVYLEKLFAGWGVLEQVRARIVVPPPGVPVGSLIADGSVELGFQQWSELKGVTGVEVLGPLPSSIQLITTFAGGVAAVSGVPDLARQLLVFMASEAAAPIKSRHGMEAAALIDSVS